MDKAEKYNEFIGIKFILGVLLRSPLSLSQIVSSCGEIKVVQFAWLYTITLGVNEKTIGVNVGTQ